MKILSLQFYTHKLVYVFMCCCFVGVLHAETFDWNKQDEKGRSLLHHIYSGSAWGDKTDEEKVSLLKKAFAAGVVNLNLKDAYGATAAHYAMNLVFYGKRYNYDTNLTSYRFSLDFFKVLITQPNLDPNIRNNHNKYTPFMKLIISNGGAVVETVFSKDKYPRLIKIFEYFTTHKNFVLNYQKNTHNTLSDAIEKEWSYDRDKNIPHFKTLVKSKNLTLTKPDKYNTNESYSIWYTINEMDVGLELVNPHTYVNNIKDYKQYLKDRFDNGAEPDYSENGYTALNTLATSISRYHGADEESNDKLRTQLGQVLIDKGADINTVTKTGETPLHNALSGRNVFFIKILLAQPRLNLNSQNRAGNTPIMSFIKYYWSKDEFETIMNLLYQHKNNINLTLKNYEGYSALDIIKQVTNSRNSKFFEKWVETI